MKLSKQLLQNIIPQPGLIIPDEKIFELPEKVLQFGTGVLLRGLPDYFIDKANRNGIFNGRIVVVKSTVTGAIDSFSQQDGLYTLCIRGVENGKRIEETIINSSVSRVLSANEDWNTILKCAYDPAMQIIVSNTTEVGIVLDADDDIHLAPPRSFPGKLLKFLSERFKAFNGTNESGMVIIPTELVIDNGTKLQSIVIELAQINQLGTTFIEWLQNSNYFCNSLVDRIVPGALTSQDNMITEKKLGYKDDLMIMCENFRLWAIESADKKVKEILSFSKSDEGVIITDNIEKFRELKLRLLNGTHSFSCGLAILAGFNTVKEAMNDNEMSGFINDLLMHELVPAVINESISKTEASGFAEKVLDRFRNPFLQHKWLSISLNYTSKMRTRNISLLQWYYNKIKKVPQSMALGFAAWLLFMKCKKADDGNYYGEINGQTYKIEDESAAWFAGKWVTNDTDSLVDLVLKNEKLWNANLSALSGFAKAIKENINLIQKKGVAFIINSRQLQKTSKDETQSIKSTS